MLAAFFLSLSMHALGHAALALAAGASARALVASMSTVRDLSPAVAMKVGLDDALFLALAGLAAATMKAVGGAHASYLQARLSGEVGGYLRLAVLDAWLRGHEGGPPPAREAAAPQEDRHGAGGSGAEPRRWHTRHGDHGAANFVSVAPTPAQGVAALTFHVREVEAGMKLGLLGGIRAVAQIVPLVAALIWLAPKLAVFAIVAVLPFAVGLSLARRRFKRAHVRGTAETEALLEAADEAVRHADLWRTYGAEAKARSSIATLGRAITRRGARLEGAAAALSGTNEVLGALALVLALVAARSGGLGNSIGGGTLIAFATTFFLSYRPLRDFGDARLAWSRAGAAFDALAPLLAPAGERARELLCEASVGAPRRSWEPACLELRNVRLSRGSGAPLSFRLEAGAILAIVGPNGSGKTTLLRTLLGLDPVAGGEIVFGGEHLGARPAGPAARPFAWVPQDAPLLAETVDANVDLAGEGLRAADVLSSLGAAHLAGALDGARLGAGGRSVSGGERQWIALARALATRQPVLLLDEPTSGLDDAAQKRVLDAIVRLRGARTVLLVTHRPEPIAIADVVVHLGGDARIVPPDLPGSTAIPRDARAIQITSQAR